MLFKDVHGHDELKHKLIQNIRNERVPHAQLFLGPEGSGNLGLALATTQMIYCENPSEYDSCGICSSCIKISKLTHPDVHFSFPTVGAREVSSSFLTEWREMVDNSTYFNAVDWTSKIAKDENKTLNITKEESRDIISKLSLKPFEGEAKTLILWMPEYLQNVGNSLLKIIEEPPQKTYFMLVAHNFDALLTTITSRTQLVKVPAYTHEDVMRYLIERYQLDQSRAENISFLSEGNLNAAITLVESVENNYAEMFRTWMLACYQNNLQVVAATMDELAKLGRTQIQLFLRNGLKILRESLLFKHVDNYEIKFEGEYKDFIKKFSNTLNANYIEQSYELINDVIYHIGRNANAKIALFNLSLALRHNFIRKR